MQASVKSRSKRVDWSISYNVGYSPFVRDSEEARKMGDE